mmetsp:Transcript_36493/g.97152  ORF Transcript_36493/g.97152 Transcript_36493/m.97152 type:complete len:261 (-) Transcript_36493:1078-1860(-)
MFTSCIDLVGMIQQTERLPLFTQLRHRRGPVHEIRARNAHGIQLNLRVRRNVAALTLVLPINTTSDVLRNDVVRDALHVRDHDATATDTNCVHIHFARFLSEHDVFLQLVTPRLLRPNWVVPRNQRREPVRLVHVRRGQHQLIVQSISHVSQHGNVLVGEVRVRGRRHDEFRLALGVWPPILPQSAFHFETLGEHGFHNLLEVTAIHDPAYKADKWLQRLPRFHGGLVKLEHLLTALHIGLFGNKPHALFELVGHSGCLA